MALLLAPLAVAAVSIMRLHWVPTGDIAVIDLRSRDVFSLHPPFTGLFSRRGWNHPGPAMFWLLAPFAWLGRSAPVVLREGWLLIDAAVLAAAVLLAARVNRTLLLVVASTAALSYLALPAPVHRIPWNPWMPVPMLVLLLVLVVRAGSGRPRDLIGVVVVGSLMVQIHAGIAPIVVGLSAIALGRVVLDARAAPGGPRTLRTPLLWSLGLGAVLWTVPIVGAVIGEPGNLRVLVRYFLDAPDPPLGLARAVRIMAAEFAWRPPWLGGPYRVQSLLRLAVGASPGWLVPPIVVLVAGWALARRTGRRDDARLVVTALAALGLGIVAISRADVAFAYTFEWRGVVAAFAVAVAGVPFVRYAVGLYGARLGRVVVALVVTVVAASTIIAVPKLGRRPADEDLQARAMRSIRTALASEPALGGRRILVLDTVGEFPTQALRTGVIDELDRRGAAVRASGMWARSFGSGRIAGVRRVDEVWALVVGDGAIADVASVPGARVVWRARPAGTADRDTLALRAALRAQLLAAGRDDLVPSLDLTSVDPRLADVAGLDPRYVALLAARQRAMALADPCRCALIATPGGRADR